MLIRFSPYLKKQELWAEGQELISVLGRDRDKTDPTKRRKKAEDWEKELVAKLMNPVLVTDNYRISQMNPTKRDTLHRLYKSPLTLEYDGVSVKVNDHDYPTVWGPSIDTLVFCNALKTAGVLTDDVATAVDIGCASGFIGKYILYKCKNLKELFLVDLNEDAIKCATENVKRLHENQAVYTMHGDGRRLAGRKFDLVACSPPYVPRPRSIDDNPYEGVSLLHDIIVDGKDYLNEGGKLILTTSSLCQRITSRAIKEAKKNGGLNSVQVIRRKHVPLKVNPILNNGEWMSYLYKTGLEKKLEKGYEHWQTIKILKLMYR